MSIFQQRKEDCQWGCFDYNLASFNLKKKTLHVDESMAYSEHYERIQCAENNIGVSRFKAQGTCYISKVSKYDMDAIPADVASQNQK